MNDLENTLRKRRTVPDDRLQAFAARLSGRLRRRLLFRVAAAVLIPLAIGGALLAAPAGEPADPARVLVLARTDGRGESNYEPPGIGQLVAESDAAIVARVRKIEEAAVSLEVREVIYGPPGRDFKEVPERSRHPHSCSRVMTWTPGEECILFLWRDPETGGFEVKHDGAGKIDFPWAGVFDRAAITEMIRTGSLSPERLAALVGEFGPRVLMSAAGELWGHPEERMADDAPPIQVALEGWIGSKLPAGEVEGIEVLSVLRFLAPERLRALPPPVRTALRNAVVEKENVYTRLQFMEGLVRAGVPEIRDDFHAFLARLEAAEVRDPADSSWVRLRTRAFALQAIHDPESALPKLWKIYESRTLAGLFDRGDVLEFLLPLDPDRAAHAIVEFTRDRIAAGFAPRPDLLAKAPGPEASAALRRALLRPDYAAGYVGRREDLREAFLGAKGLPRLAAMWETILERLREVDDAPGDLAVWVELLAAGEGGIAPALPRIRTALHREDADEEGLVDLIRAFQNAVGKRWLVFRSPTAAELESARLEGLRYRER